MQPAEQRRARGGVLGRRTSSPRRRGLPLPPSHGAPRRRVAHRSAQALAQVLRAFARRRAGCGSSRGCCPGRSRACPGVYGAQRQAALASQWGCGGHPPGSSTRPRTAALFGFELNERQRRRGGRSRTVMGGQRPARVGRRRPAPGSYSERVTSTAPAAQNYGEVFTRRWVVDVLLDLTGYTADRDLGALRLLEPSCGSGAFLGPAVQRLIASAAAHGRDLATLVLQPRFVILRRGGPGRRAATA